MNEMFKGWGFHLSSSLLIHAMQNANQSPDKSNEVYKQHGTVTRYKQQGSTGSLAYKLGKPILAVGDFSTQFSAVGTILHAYKHSRASFFPSQKLLLL